MLLWPAGRPGKALSEPAVSTPFKRAIDHGELPPQMRVHELRHSCASLFLIDGGDILKLSKIVGHRSSVTITECTYAHLKPDAYEAGYGRVAFRMPSADRGLEFSAALVDNSEAALTRGSSKGRGEGGDGEPRQGA